MTNTCPVCQKDDAVQRVAALVAAGQSSGTFFGPTGGVTYSDGKWGSVGGFSVLSGSSTTNLARLLASPAKPLENLGLYYSLNGCGWFFIIVGILFAISMPITITHEPNGTLLTGLFVGLFAGVLYAGLGFLSRVWGGSQRKKAEEKYSNEMKVWSNAMTRWERLYFCHRDGIAFDSETNKSFEPTQIQEYIYK